MIGRWLRRRLDPHERLIEDVRRTAGLMEAVFAEARAIEVLVPTTVEVTVWSWRSWAERLESER